MKDSWIGVMYHVFSVNWYTVCFEWCGTKPDVMYCVFSDVALNQMWCNVCLGWCSTKPYVMCVFNDLTVVTLNQMWCTVYFQWCSIKSDVREIYIYIYIYGGCFQWCTWWCFEWHGTKSDMIYCCFGDVALNQMWCTVCFQLCGTKSDAIVIYCAFYLGDVALNQTWYAVCFQWCGTKSDVMYHVFLVVWH